MSYQLTAMEERLFGDIIGIYAYDTGSTDSGIRNEVLRAKIKNELEALDETELRCFFSRLVREEFLTERALERGYGIEDAASFNTWLEDGNLL